MKKIVFCFLFLAISVYAEDSAESGRLPDGRAYRTDDQGYQLVDYVAELELKVDELQNKIIAINNEKKFQAVDSEFSETNLMAEMAAKKAAEAKCPSCPVIECEEPKEASCEHVEDAYKLEIKQAEKRILSMQESLSEKEKTIGNYEMAQESGSDQEAALKEARQQVARLQLRLEEKDRELRENETLAASRSGDLGKQNAQLTEATNKISGLEQEVHRLQLALSAEKKSAAESTSSAAVVALSEAAPVVVSDEKRSSAFDHLKTKLTADLSTYNQLLEKRTALYRVYQTLPIKRTITVTLSPTETSDGYNAQKIQNSISQAYKFSELGAIQKNLFILTRDVRKDLTVLQRLTQR